MKHPWFAAAVLTLAVADSYAQSWQSRVGEDGGNNSSGIGALLGALIIVVIGVFIARTAGGMAKKKEEGFYVLLAYGIAAMVLFLPIGAVLESVGEPKEATIIAAPLAAWLIGHFFPKD